MKMKADHYATLDLVCKEVVANSQANIRALYRENGFTDRRFYWDVFNQATRGLGTFVSQLYGYLNDSHIETALKHILE